MNRLPEIHRHPSVQRALIWSMGRPFLLAFIVFHKVGLLRNMKPRVRAVIKYSDYVLLVREAADFNRWSVPGGGVKSDESPKRALSREMKEELGLFIPERLFKHTGTHAANDVFAPHDIIVFEASIDNAQHIRLQYEILDAQWWKLDDLPKNLSPGARMALQVYLQK